MKTQETIRIELTPEQQAQIQRLTGKEPRAVKLNLEALEERLTPGIDTTPSFPHP